MTGAHELHPDISEDVLQSRVEDYCRWRGLRFHHETDSRRSRAGFPDLVIVGPGGLLFAELKKRTGKPTAEQRAWLADLAAADVEAHLWRPADWPAICTRLDQLARLPAPRETRQHHEARHP